MTQARSDKQPFKARLRWPPHGRKRPRAQRGAIHRAAAALLALSLSAACISSPVKRAAPGNVIFFHPDGMSLAHWDIGRIITVGPDGLSPWDDLSHMAIYKPHLKSNLVPSSNAGATVHAYGVKVDYSSFGRDGGEALRHPSLLKEAQNRGLHTGLCQSGALVEPGTAVFAANARNRREIWNITEQLIHSQVKILLGGGEKFLLPKGVYGRFGPGEREDGKNLIQTALSLGYHVIYTREELENIPLTASKVLGIFAHDDTYNDKTEEALRKEGLLAYQPEAPTIAEMAKASLEFLSRDKSKRFFLVVEEEGTDNFSNKNNAPALFEAIKRSLEAIAEARKFVRKNKSALLLVASDSNAGSPALVDRLTSRKLFQLRDKIGSLSDNQAPMDGSPSGTPFASAPDRKGLNMPFAILWPTKTDTGAGLLVKGEGLNRHKIKGALDNTDIYKIMRETLFPRQAKSGEAEIF